MIGWNFRGGLSHTTLPELSECFTLVPMRERGNEDFCVQHARMDNRDKRNVSDLCKVI